MTTIARAFWKPAGGIYLALSLAGLAAGLWPRAIHPPASSVNPAPLPTLSALAVAQASFFILVWPIVIARRGRAGGAFRAGRDAAETLGLLLAGTPLYIMAAWFSDGVVADVMRVAILLAATAPLAWLAGRLLAGGWTMPWTLLAMLLLAAGLPLLHYILLDFARPLPVDWAWSLSPVSLAWSAGTARGASALPAPLWAPLLWLAAAGAGFAARGLLNRETRNSELTGGGL